MSKIDRTKNAKRNIICGFVNKIVLLILPFFLRTVIIHKLGAEYLGLNGLFTSILQVLSLSELGFGTAVVYCMYKPIAEDNYEELNGILSYFKKIYLLMGIIIFCLGVAVLPFLPKLINNDIPADINIYYLYLIFLLNTCVSYILFAYKTSLLAAYQRNDVIVNISTIIQFLVYIFQFIMIYVFNTYYGYVLIMLAGTILNNIFISLSVKHIFRNKIKAYGSISKETKNEIFIKVKGLIIDKLCGTSRNAFDNIFISYFLGLIITAKYNNYYYIMFAIIGLLGVFTSSILSGVGNSIQLESTEKNYSDMSKINFIYMWIVGNCTVCLLCLYQPFTELFFGAPMLLPIGVVILLCLYFYVFEMGDIRAVYSSAAGLWWENRYRVLIESILNIILNFVFGKLFGIYGIVLATLITLFFINYIWGNKIVFDNYFKNQSRKKLYLNAFIHAVLTILTCIISYLICNFLPVSILGLVIRLFVCLVLINTIYIIAYLKTKTFKETLSWIKRIIKMR